MCFVSCRTGGDCRRSCVRDGPGPLARGSHSPQVGARPSGGPARPGRRRAARRAAPVARLDASRGRLRVPPSILLASRRVARRAAAAARRVSRPPSRALYRLVVEFEYSFNSRSDGCGRVTQSTCAVRAPATGKWGSNWAKNRRRGGGRRARANEQESARGRDFSRRDSGEALDCFAFFSTALLSRRAGRRRRADRSAPGRPSDARFVVYRVPGATRRAQPLESTD